MTVSLDLEPLKIAVTSFMSIIDRYEQAHGVPSRTRAPEPVCTASLVRAVGYNMGVTPAAICGPRRHAALVRARTAACWLLRQLTTYSLVDIGLVLGGRDHTTIGAAIRRAEDMRRRDPAFAMLTDRLLRQFQSLKEH